MIKRSMVLGLVALLVFLVGCSEVEKVQDQFCDNLEKLEEPLDSLQKIDANTRIQDIQGLRETLDKAFDLIDKSPIDLGVGALDEIEQTFRNLQQKLQDAEEQGTLQDVADDIKQAGVQVRAAYDKLHRQVCGSGE
jgi:hypothetical protein